jgi:hypothetical protein
MRQLETKSQPLTLALRHSNLACDAGISAERASPESRKAKSQRTKKNSLETEVSKLVF